MRVRVLLLALALTATLFAAGCRQQSIVADTSQVRYRGYEAYAHHGQSSADAQYVRFKQADGVEEFSIYLSPELRRLVFEYVAQIASGQMTVKVINPEGKAILGGTTDASGHLKLYHSLRVPSGRYTVRTEYRQAKQGEIRYTIYGYYK